MDGSLRELDCIESKEDSEADRSAFKFKKWG